MGYELPIYSTYVLPAADLTTPANLLKVMGPAGKQGRLDSIGAVITTGVTVGAASVDVGDDADDNQYGTLSVPIASASTTVGYNTAVISDSDVNYIPADIPVLISTDGGGTAGAADIVVVIAWF